jgi:protein-S-isoprenylcysteine O-methyltransferase Ste14
VGVHGCVVVAIEQLPERFSWLRRPAIRAVLALRAVEVLLVALLPTLATRHRLLQAPFRLTDAVAVVGTVSLSAGLGILVWRERAPEARSSERRAGIGRESLGSP